MKHVILQDYFTIDAKIDRTNLRWVRKWSRIMKLYLSILSHYKIKDQDSKVQRERLNYFSE